MNGDYAAKPALFIMENMHAFMGIKSWVIEHALVSLGQLKGRRLLDCCIASTPRYLSVDISEPQQGPNTFLQLRNEFAFKPIITAQPVIVAPAWMRQRQSARPQESRPIFDHISEG